MSAGIFFIVAPDNVYDPLHWKWQMVLDNYPCSCLPFFPGSSSSTCTLTSQGLPLEFGRQRLVHIVAAASSSMVAVASCSSSSSK